MVDGNVNIAAELVNNRVCCTRPPVAPRFRQQLISTYTQQLASTKHKRIKENVSRGQKGYGLYRHNSSPDLSNAKHTSNAGSVIHKTGQGNPAQSRNCKNTQESSPKIELHASGQKKKPLRRVQSAKAILDNSTVPDMFVKDLSTHRKRPQSASSIQKSTSHVTRRERPSSAGSSRSEGPVSAPSEELEPYVYGYTSRRSVCGSESDLMASQDNLCQTQWKLSATSDEMLPGNNPSPSVVPKTLTSLLPWLTPDVPTHWTGVDSGTCLIFLPSLVGEFCPDDLPVVPPEHSVGDELVYTEKIVEPAQWVPPKKYEHPWTKIPLPEYKCCHRHSRPSNPMHVQILSPSGNILHESYTGKRTADVVREEIEELEKLMKGIGTADGTSIVVQYQAEINHLQSMIDKTRGRVEEIQRREQEKWEAQQPKDTFGLRAFHKQHDEVMEKIRQQYENCINELAALEGDPSLDGLGDHFRDRQKQICSNDNL